LVFLWIRFNAIYLICIFAFIKIVSLLSIKFPGTRRIPVWFTYSIPINYCILSPPVYFCNGLKDSSSFLKRSCFWISNYLIICPSVSIRKKSMIYKIESGLKLINRHPNSRSASRSIFWYFGWFLSIILS